MKSVDFKQINERLLHNAMFYLPDWLPGGEFQGSEYICSDVSGGKGGSLSFNFIKGFGRDYKTGQKFGDMISLYAAVKGISQIEAARSFEVGVATSSDPKPSLINQIYIAPIENLIPPPKGNLYPIIRGSPTGEWCYRDENGEVQFYVFRYDINGRKIFCPYSYSQTSSDWVKKSWRSPRPIYGLEKLKKNKNATVVICEGERAADSAQKILGDSVITVSWSNGAAAVDFTDWKPIKDRSLVLWPDHDDPGYAAMSKIFLKLCKFNHTIKLIKFFGKDFGWDAHDSFLRGECVNLSESRNYTPEEYKIIDVKNWTPADFEFHEFDI